MLKSNLIAVLRTFSKKEIRELRKWLNSPAHNQREDVTNMYNYLFEDDHLYKDDFLDKEVAFKWIYREEKIYNDAKMRQVMFFFMKALEEFLTFQELFSDEVRSKLTLASVYRKRKLDKIFKKNMQSSQVLQDKQPLRNGLYLRNEYLILQEDYAYIVSQDREVKMNLQEVSDALDATFIADKLRQACHMNAHQAVYKMEYNIGMLEEVIQFVEHNNVLDIPAIAVYYYGLKTNTDRENINHFVKLKEQLEHNIDLFPTSEQRDLYLMAVNYCIWRINRGDKDYIREAFELNRRGFEKGILINNGVITRFNFKNFVTLGTHLKEFEYVNHFIENYQQFLDEKYRDSMVHYSRAKYYFEKGDYSNAMKLFNQIEYDDILLTLNAKLMLLKMYYEEEEISALDSLLDSTLSYMRRKKVMGYQKAVYQNFIRYTKKMLKVNPYITKEKEKLQLEIEAANPLTEKKWLIKQLMKMKS